MLIGYLRVSTNKQDENNQRHAISQVHTPDKWLAVECSSRKSQKARRLTELLDQVSPGDVIVVTELSRLARSTSELLLLVDCLIKQHVGLIAMKQGLTIPANGDQMDPLAKMTVTIFGLMAELERDFVSSRTREGLAAKRSEGVVLGKPPGTIQTSILDARVDEIKLLRSAGASTLSISRYLGCGYATITHYLRTRRV